MRDGSTRKIPAAGARTSHAFLERHLVVLVALTGPEAGTEYPLERPCTRVGRGPGVELSFADQAMSRQHAAFELAADGFRLRDLGSTNGCLVNGARVEAADLKHADKIQIGEHQFQLVISERTNRPRAHLLRGE
jgi:pSer/pThr/pTyr-binding forkhead associated (FHA) protein